MAAATRRIGIEERRARLGVRHHLAANAQASGAVEVAQDLVGLHGTDPASVFLAAGARMVTGEPSVMERALYEERSLVRMLGMRRTMFVVPLDLAPVVQAACTTKIAAQERRRLVQHLDQAQVAPDPATWLKDVEESTLRAPPIEVAQLEMARRWLAAFGPGTIADLQWWSGWTAGDTRRALAQLEVAEVELGGTTGLVLAGDVEQVAATEPWAALLPALDPTTMGWSDRGWFLGVMLRHCSTGRAISAPPCGGTDESSAVGRSERKATSCSGCSRMSAVSRSQR